MEPVNLHLKVKYFLLVSLIGSSIGFADPPPTLTWLGGTSSMNTASNWNPAQIPNTDGKNDTLVFPNTGATRSVTNDIAGTLLTGNITINSNYTLTGNAFGVVPETGFSVTFTSTGATIDVSSLILNGTWSVTSLASPGNAINADIIGGTSGNLNLLNGFLTLGGTNSYSGVITVGNETPLLTNPAAILRATAANVFGGAGFNTNVTVASTATLDLNNFNNAVGTLSGTTGSKVLLGSATLTVNDGSAQTPFYGVISGSGGVTVATSGLALMGANTYTGATTIQSGGHLDILSVGNTSGFTFGAGQGILVFGQTASIALPFTLQDTGNIGVIGGATITLSGGTISGGNSLVKRGPGTLSINGANNSNAGNLHIWGGTLLLTNGLGSANGFTFDSPTLNSGTLKIGTGISTISSPFSFSKTQGIIDTNGNDVSLSGAISGGYYLEKVGAGKLTLSAIGNLINAKTKISQGTLSVIPSTYNTSTQTVFSGAGTGTLQIGNDYDPFASSVVFMANGSIDTNSYNMHITGVIAGLSSYTFNKVGLGILTLSASNLYQGPTHVTGGTLRAASASSSAGGAFGINSNMTVDSGATLDFGTFANSVGSLSNSGTVTSQATISAISFTQTSSGLLTLNFPTSAATPYGNVVTTGTISLDGLLTVNDSGGYTPTSGTEIMLLQSSGTGKKLAGSFDTVTLASQFSAIGKVHYDYSNNKVYIGLASCNGNWQGTSSGNWADTAKWVGGCAPGVGSEAASNDAATFSNVAGTPITVTLATSDGSAAQSVTLHHLSFESTSTVYAIQQYNNTSQIILDKPTPSLLEPEITMAATVAVLINAPIVMNTDSRIFLSSGTLTLGASTTVTGSTSTLYISEGLTAGTLVNNGSMSPLGINLEGGTLQNQGTLLPTGPITIAGLQGILSPLTVTNSSTMTAGTTFTIGGTDGATSVTNSGTMNSTGAFLIASGTVANSLTMNSATSFSISGGIITNSGTMSSAGAFSMSGGELTNSSSAHLYAAAGQTFTLSGGTLTNSSGAFLGLSTTNFTLSGGTLVTSAQVLANNYTQSSGSTLQLNFPSSSATPYGNISTAGAIQIGGSLTVTDTGSFSPPATGEIVLLTSSGSGKQLSGTFSAVTLPINFSQATVTYDHSENQVLLAFSSCNGVWQSTSSGNWANNANWDGGCAPGVGSMASDHDIAIFNDVSAGSITTTLATSSGSAAQSVTLHTLIFDAPSTQYTLQQFDATSQLILDADVTHSKSRISALSGLATINAPIVCNADSRIYLSGGDLILGAVTTITSPSSTLYISEGSTASTLTNNGSITPPNVIIEGGFLINNGTIHPSNALTISGLAGIATPTTVANNDTMIAGTTFTVGGTSGGTLIVNSGTMNALGNFLIQSGTLTNDNGAFLGIASSDMIVSGGTLITSGAVLAHTYTQNGTGTLQFNVANGTTFGHLNASQANLESAAIVNALSGFPSSGTHQITLISTDAGVSGTFGNVTFLNFPPSVIPDLIYSANTVVLNTQPSVPAHFSAHSQIVFTAVAQHNSLISRKSFQMRSRLPKPPPKVITFSESDAPKGFIGEEEGLTASLFLFPFKKSSSELPIAEIPPSEMNAQITQASSVQKQENLTERVKQQGKPYNVYAGPVGSFGHVDTVEDQLGFSYASAGGLAGFDVIFPATESSAVQGGIGVIAEYRQQWSHAYQHSGTVSTDKAHGSLYGTLMSTALPNFAIDAIAGFAYAWDHLTRNTGIDNLRQAQGTTHEKIYISLIGFEYEFPSKYIAVTPLLHLQYAYDHIDGFKERGAGIYNLRVHSQHVQSFASSFGARFAHSYTGKNWGFTAELDAEWIREYLNKSRSVLFTPFEIGSIPTAISTAKAPRNSGLVTVDLLFTFPKGWQTEANASIFLNEIAFDAFFYFTIGRLF